MPISPALFRRAVSRRRSLPMIRGFVAVTAVAASMMLGACGTVGPKPWERDLMARPEMALDAAPVDSAIDDHVYFSKEGASGGRGFGGGGCGCN
jgi:hypothetical protein